MTILIEVDPDNQALAALLALLRRTGSVSIHEGEMLAAPMEHQIEMQLRSDDYVTLRAVSK